MKTRATDGLDRIVTFYDPHPGFLGAAVPLPSTVKKVVDELDGKSMNLQEAVSKIQAVTKGTLTIFNDCILLKIGSESNLPMHVWRLIKFR